MSIGDKLNSLYKELERVQGMSNEAVCINFNVDNKQQYIDMLNEEIDGLEDEITEKENYNKRERNFIKTSDVPFICW